MIVLLAADGATFVAVRGVVRAVRDSALLGPAYAALVEGVIPKGYLGGWQFGAALLIGLGIAGTYGRGDERRNTGRMLLGVVLAVSLSLWDSLWTLGMGPVALQFLVTALLMWGGLSLERGFIELLITHFVPAKYHEDRIVVVGDRSDPDAAGAVAAFGGNRRFVPLGWVYPGTGEVNGEYLGTTERFWDLLHVANVDSVVLCGDLAPETFESVVEASCAAGCHVLALSRHRAIARARPGLVWNRGVPFVQISVPALRAWQLAIKRMIDVVVAGVGLIVLSPLLGLIALAIKFDSLGPVLFWQERVGYGGSVFRMLKFRTMREGADAEKPAVAHLNHSKDSRLFKIPNDPRVTRLGAWLRRWSLDELPQLWNVLKGEMSLVGPRPFFEADLARYSDHHFGRLGAKPGITGLWQVKGRSDVVDFEEVVRLDREYIDQWSLWLDFKILLRTFPAVASRSGAF